MVMADHVPYYSSQWRYCIFWTGIVLGYLNHLPCALDFRFTPNYGGPCSENRMSSTDQVYSSHVMMLCCGSAMLTGAMYDMVNSDIPWSINIPRSAVVLCLIITSLIFLLVDEVDPERRLILLQNGVACRSWCITTCLIVQMSDSYKPKNFAYAIFLFVLKLYSFATLFILGWSPYITGVVVETLIVITVVGATIFILVICAWGIYDNLYVKRNWKKTGMEKYVVVNYVLLGVLVYGIALIATLSGNNGWCNVGYTESMLYDIIQTVVIAAMHTVPTKMAQHDAITEKVCLQSFTPMRS